MKAHVLDIESFAISKERILATIPEWDADEARSRVPASYKKAETISAWIEDDKANHGKDLLDKAALLPEYATVAIVGLMSGDRVTQYTLGSAYNRDYEATFLNFDHEANLLENVWNDLDNLLSRGDIITGYHIKGFDIPFLIRRSWLLGMPVPQSVYNSTNRYPLSQQFVDLREVWTAGRREDLAKRVKLQDVLKACNLPLKTGDGSEFGKLWESDRAAALEYNRNDLICEHALAERLGVVQKPSRLTSPSLIASMDEIGVLP